MSRRLLHIDWSNLAMRVIMGNAMGNGADTSTLDLWLWMMLDKVLTYAKKTGPYTDIILSLDAQEYWRRLVYPPYKANRKARKEDMDKAVEKAVGMPLNAVLTASRDFAFELAEHTPIKTLRVPLAEADDTIATLCMNLPVGHVIASRDKDFTQLLRFPNVRIYDPHEDAWVSDNPDEWLEAACLMGQGKDNIHNVLTPTPWGRTTRTEGKRRPGFGEAAVKKALAHEEGVAGFMRDKMFTKKGKPKLAKDKGRLDKSGKPRFKPNRYFGWEKRLARNRRLIDFREIPTAMQARILNDFAAAALPAPTYTHDKFRELCVQRNWNSYLDDFAPVVATLDTLMPAVAA